MKKSPMPPNLVNHEAVEAAAAAWLAKRDNRAAWTERDEAALQAWINEHTAHQVAWLRMEYAWERADRIGPLREAVEARVPPVVPARVRPRWYAMPRIRQASIALGLMGMLAIGGVTAWRSQQPAGDADRYVTAVGARQTLTLNDGSRVTLNTRTKARATVSPASRTFWLEDGEAFFEIQHDPAHPFVVNAGNDRITVLGTKFSVRHEDGRTQVLVLEGRVRLDQQDAAGASSPAASGQPVSTVLVKNENAVAQPGAVLVTTRSSTQTQDELSWREGRLVFDNATLAEIAAEFNRYNRRQVVVQGDAASIRLSGRFETYNIDGFVRLIKAGFRVTVQENGDQVVLSSS